MNKPLKILITGICGHSYGAQIAKSLSLLTSQHNLYGADANPQTLPTEILVKKLFTLPHAGSKLYLESLALLYKEHNIDYLIEGSEIEQKVLNENRDFLKKHSINWMSNKKQIIDLCLDKKKLSLFLQQNNFPFPKLYQNLDCYKEQIEFPLILKPNFQSGGSSHVYIAQNKDDIKAIVQLSRIKLEDFCIQEYVGTYDSEYTVGILHNNKGNFLGSATLKRNLTQALSIKIVVSNLTNRVDLGEKLVVSSGFSQGELMHHKMIEDYCRSIAEKLGSTGPLNFQGRLYDDKFYIFEINPRFSGTSFMRALSGFNEAYIWIKNFNKTFSIDPFYVHKSIYYKRIIKEIKI